MKLVYVWLLRWKIGFRSMGCVLRVTMPRMSWFTQEFTSKNALLSSTFLALKLSIAPKGYPTRRFANHRLNTSLIDNKTKREIMLAADKLQLQSSLKQQATALKEKEFNLHHNNFSEFPLFL
jgi:hypothetical protein